MLPMTTQGVLVCFASIGIAITVAVPVHRALRRGSPGFNAIAAVVVAGVLAIAASIVFLN
jgi:hypothetical protein